MARDLKIGEIVVVPWGLVEIRGRILKIYGPRPRSHVLIELTPELSGDITDEVTTVSLPLDAVRRAIAA